MQGGREVGGEDGELGGKVLAAACANEEDEGKARVQLVDLHIVHACVCVCGGGGGKVTR